jgi:Holliday junction DNA helicase RuvB
MNENLDASSNSLSSDEHEFEQNLRPLSFADFTGQDHILENLKILL